VRKKSWEKLLDQPPAGSWFLKVPPSRSEVGRQRIGSHPRCAGSRAVGDAFCRRARSGHPWNNQPSRAAARRAAVTSGLGPGPRIRRQGRGLGTNPTNKGEALNAPAAPAPVQGPWPAPPPYRPPVGQARSGSAPPAGWGSFVLSGLRRLSSYAGAPGGGNPRYW